jgi:hypothetical protein
LWKTGKQHPNHPGFPVFHGILVDFPRFGRARVLRSVLRGGDADRPPVRAHGRASLTPERLRLSCPGGRNTTRRPVWVVSIAGPAAFRQPGGFSVVARLSRRLPAR